jgi:GWxTD domain-containing protein
MTVPVYCADKLNMYITYTRFLNKSGSTVLNIDYQIPYRNMVFVSQNSGFFAELQVSINVTDGDSLVFQKGISDNIGVRNKHDVSSPQKSYLNRISLLVDRPGYNVLFKAQDVNSGAVFEWNIKADPLLQTTMISDVEMSQTVRADTTQFLEKFQRNHKLYKVEPSALFSKEQVDSFSLYFEIYRHEANSEAKYVANLLIENDEEIEIETNLSVSSALAVEGNTIKIPISDLAPGAHHGTITIQSGEIVEQRQFEFVIYENSGGQRFIFPDPQDEHSLMKYFLSSGIVGNWSSMSLESKRRYISQFWEVMANSANLSPEEMIGIVRERIQFADKYYSHFDKGWKSDMGRIYIRNGAPDEIEKDQTTDDTRFVRKDFQIWKYSLRNNAVYVFIDLQMNGNFRLIFAKNDDMELDVNEIEKYLGTTFDTSRLNN